MSTARARRDDPWTSWAAARSLPDLTPRKAAIVHILDREGPATLEQIVLRYRAYKYGPQGPYPHQSDSSIRSRTAELVDAGIVKDTGTTCLTASGRKARVLALADNERLF